MYNLHNMKNTQRGSMGIIAIIIIAIIVIGGGVYVYHQKVKSKISTINKELVEQEEISTDNVKNETPSLEDTQKTNTITSVKSDTNVKVTTPSSVNVSNSNNVDTKFDTLFKRWITAWNKRDVNVLVNTFGYGNSQVQKMEDKNIWHYDTYLLYKSKSTPPSADDIDFYKKYGGEIPFDVKVTGYYVISKSSGVYSVAIIDGNYKKNTDIGAITQWQIFPSEYDPKTYSSIEEAKTQIDKLSKI